MLAGGSGVCEEILTGARGLGLVKTADVVIIGSGSLARGIGYVLSQVSTGSLRVAIIGRSVGKVSRMAVIANARAASFGASATFSALGFPEFKALAFSRALRSLKPKVVLLAASLQSPWERSQGETGWTRLIAAGGGGGTAVPSVKVTLPRAPGALRPS